jgi:hypothetical protein
MSSITDDLARQSVQMLRLSQSLARCQKEGVRAMIDLLSRHSLPLPIKAEEATGKTLTKLLIDSSTMVCLFADNTAVMLDAYARDPDYEGQVTIEVCHTSDRYPDFDMYQYLGLLEDAGVAGIDGAKKEYRRLRGWKD